MTTASHSQGFWQFTDRKNFIDVVMNIVLSIASFVFGLFFISQMFSAITAIVTALVVVNIPRFVIERWMKEETEEFYNQGGEKLYEASRGADESVVKLNAFLKIYCSLVKKSTVVIAGFIVNLVLAAAGVIGSEVANTVTVALSVVLTALGLYDVIKAKSTKDQA